MLCYILDLSFHNSTPSGGWIIMSFWIEGRSLRFKGALDS